MQECVEVFVRALRLPIQAPVLRALPAGGADVAIARAGIVGAHPLAACAAEQLIERLLGHLAVEIPQREVECRRRARLDTRRTPAHVGGDAAGEGLDGERVPPQYAWRD